MTKAFFLSAVLLCLTVLSQAQTQKNISSKISIDFNKNIELFGYMVFLAEPDNNSPEHPITKILTSQPQDLNNSALHKIYEMAGSMPYAFFVELFYAIPVFPTNENIVLPEEVLKRYGYTESEQEAMAKKLIALANQFYLESEFEQIWSAMEVYRNQTISGMSNILMNKQEVSDMEQFYGDSFNSYKVVPSLTIWSGPGWGFPSGDEGTRSATFVLGPLESNYEFNVAEKLKDLTIHEFGHSFVNPVLWDTSKDVIEKTEMLYEPIKDSMAQQAYTNWETSITEHFVRASEILIPKNYQGADKTELLQSYTVNRQFIYLPFIVERLEYYRFDAGEPYQEAVRMTMIDLFEKHR